MEEDLKNLVLGFRKHTGKTQSEVASELDVPMDIETALELGTYKIPTESLMDRIQKLTSDLDHHDLIHIGRGYRIMDELGPDFKYFLRGLEPARGIDLKELHSQPEEEFYRIIGSVNLDEFEVVSMGRKA
jgi:transcriptional regulator with XRE-family HTH domain